MYVPACMVRAPLDMVLRFYGVFAYVAYCCGVVPGVNLVESLHGGPPPVYKLA